MTVISGRLLAFKINGRTALLSCHFRQVMPRQRQLLVERKHLRALVVVEER
jgi:hypothetical protein